MPNQTPNKDRGPARLDDMPRGSTPWSLIPSSGMVLDREETKTLRKNLKGSGAGLYKEAKREGFVSLSAYLEHLDPTPPGEVGDAFSRQVAIAQVRTKSVMDFDQALRASTMREMRQSVPELFPEFLVREYMKATFFTGLGAAFTRYYAGTQPPSELLRPSVWQRMINNPNPLRSSRLNRMIAFTQVVDETLFKRFWLEIDESDRKMRRRSEGAELPGVRIQTGHVTEQSMYEYGRKITWTDEVERFLTLDLLAYHMGLIVGQTAIDKDEDALYTIINGDGTVGSGATSVPVSTLAGGTPGDYELKPLLDFLAIWGEEGRFMPNQSFARRADAVEVQSIDFGSANWPVFQGNNPILAGEAGLEDIVKQPPLSLHANATSGAPVYYDQAQAIFQRTLAGFPLEETDRLITKGVNVATMREWVDFPWLTPGAAREIDWLS